MRNVPPAEGIIVGKRALGQKATGLLEVLHNVLVGLLNMLSLELWHFAGEPPGIVNRARQLAAFRDHPVALPDTGASLICYVFLGLAPPVQLHTIMTR